MASPLATAQSASAQPAHIANTGFRLGDDLHISDASDSDQSATSERRLSPSRKDAKPTKSQKRRNRKQIGALTDDLGDLLGAAFSSSNADSSNTAAAADTTGRINGDTVMEVDPAPAGKKMNKRTRQNLARMEARQQKSGHKRESLNHRGVQMQAAALPQVRSTAKPETRKSSTAIRRMRKKEARAKRAAAEEDRMEIG